LTSPQEYNISLIQRTSGMHHLNPNVILKL